MSAIKIGHHPIADDAPPFIIAEMSGNHGGSLEQALALVDAAAAAGAHAIKLQTYTADTMTLDIKDREFFIDDPNSLWQGHSLYDLYKIAATPWDWHPAIFQRAKEKGLLAFSTPFDASAVDFLESLDVPAYKVASFENVDIPLIQKVAATGKPVIISTGMASLAELDDAVSAARAAGCSQLILLKCTSNYPAEPTDSNLATLPHLRQLFGCQVGLSDHTLGLGVPLASVALGARVIEKHFVLSRDSDAVDAAFSMEPGELKALVEESRRAWQAVGQVSYGPTEREKRSLEHRRSLYIAKDMKAGDVLTEDNLRAIRPGLGLAPKYQPTLLGRTVSRDVAKGTPMSWELL